MRVGERWTATVELEPDDQVHGLGERAAPLNLRPGTYGLWNTEQSGSYGPEADPLYITIPVHLVVGPGRGHLGFWENTHDGTVRIGETLSATFEGGALRTYVAPGPPDRALEQFHELTGRPALPPKWALGYHQCRWGYKTDADIREVLAGFREHDLPLSAIHFDIDYMDRYRVFTVDEEAFPDLARLTADLDAEGVKAVTIIDPGVAKADDFPLYREGREKGHFLKLPDGREVNAVVWPGLVGFPDFSDPAVREWWADQYPALLDRGVAGIWHDMCEPAVFAAGVDASLPLATRHHLDGQGGDHVEGRNLYGQGMAQAGHDALRRHRPDRRPWLLTRSGLGWGPALRLDLDRRRGHVVDDAAPHALHDPQPDDVGDPVHRPRRRWLLGGPVTGALHALVPDVGVAAVLPVPLDLHHAVPRAVERRRSSPGGDPGGDDVALPPDPVPLHPSLADQPRG